MRHAHQFEGDGRQDHRTDELRLPADDRIKTAQRAFVENALLARLGDEARAELAPLLQRVDLAARARIGGSDINGRNRCLFLTSGLASCALVDRRRQRIEVAVVGREGAIGLTAFPGRDVETRTVMLAPGSGVMLERSDLRRLSGHSIEFAAVAQAACADLLQQSAGNLLAAARYGVKQRVARWLLIATERARLDALPVTHEMIATALGVRRAGVSLAFGALRAERAIDCGRRTVTVLDRPLLIEASAGSYTAVGREQA